MIFGFLMVVLAMVVLALIGLAVAVFIGATRPIPMI